MRWILVHSPIVGPETWSGVAEELRWRGHEASVPALEAVPAASGEPYWRAHAGSAVQALVAASEGAVLVAHSGAGPLLPAIRELAGCAVAAYVFVDAGIPRDGASRLELMDEEVPGLAELMRRALAAGALLPAWRDEELREALPDAAHRRRVLAGLRPQPAAYWDEALPVLAGWPDAPCAYLQLSDGYDVPAAQAIARGWPYRHIHGGHFQMMADPAAVTDALLEVVVEAGVS